MFEIIAAIVFGAASAWLVTYTVMDRKRKETEFQLEAMDHYIYYSDKEIENMLQEMSTLKAEVEGKHEYIRHLANMLDELNPPAVYTINEQGDIRRTS